MGAGHPAARYAGRETVLLRRLRAVPAVIFTSPGNGAPVLPSTLPPAADGDWRHGALATFHG